MVNISLFRHFVPLQSLVPSDRVKLAKSCSLRAYEPDQVVQGVGGRASVALYLVEGEIELRSDRGTRRVVAGGDEARHALGSDSERSASLACIRASRLLLVDRQQLDLLLTWSQTGGVEVVDLAADTTADEGDWMTAMLQSQAFEQIPPANIAQIFAAMEPCEFAAGEIIVRQGDPGDYYYVITEGRCQVVVSDESGMVEHEVAQLGMGRSFGEEALVSGNPRNATVRALTRSGLMRLAGRDFERLLKAPLLKETDLEDMPDDAVFVDVRVPAEYQRGHLPDALNLPLAQLREKSAGLDRNGRYLVYCDTGRRSASAAFLLSERGFDAWLVRGGVPADKLMFT